MDFDDFYDDYEENIQKDVSLKENIVNIENEPQDIFNVYAVVINRLFNTLNIPFTSITVKGPGNFYEYEYASYLYKELPEINKHIIEISERDYVTDYVYVTKKMNF